MMTYWCFHLLKICNTTLEPVSKLIDMSYERRIPVTVLSGPPVPLNMEEEDEGSSLPLWRESLEEYSEWPLTKSSILQVHVQQCLLVKGLELNSDSEELPSCWYLNNHFDTSRSWKFQQKRCLTGKFSTGSFLFQPHFLNEIMRKTLSLEKFHFHWNTELWIEQNLFSLVDRQ